MYDNFRNISHNVKFCTFTVQLRNVLQEFCAHIPFRQFLSPLALNTFNYQLERCLQLFVVAVLTELIQMAS